MLELAALLVLLLALVLWILFGAPREGFLASPALEGFQDAAQDIAQDVALSACPSNMKTFYLPDGRTACCDGSVTGSRCLGAVQCTMTGESQPGLPSCATLLQKAYQSKGAQCPPSMPAYFENKTQKGCTAGALNSEMTGPAHATQPACRWYPTLDENLTQKDSCELQKQLDEAPCFGTHCVKRIEVAGGPPLIAIQFVDRSGMMRIAYTRKSLENYLTNTRPKWRDEGLDLDKNVMVAEVAKALWVDRTLSEKEVQL